MILTQRLLEKSTMKSMYSRGIVNFSHLTFVTFTRNCQWTISLIWSCWTHHGGTSQYEGRRLFSQNPGTKQVKFIIYIFKNKLLTNYFLLQLSNDAQWGNSGNPSSKVDQQRGLSCCLVYKCIESLEFHSGEDVPILGHQLSREVVLGEGTLVASSNRKIHNWNYCIMNR